MRLLPLHFIFLAALCAQKATAFDCAEHAGSNEIFTKSNTNHCIFVARGTYVRRNQWDNFKKACGYTEEDRIEGYALRYGILAKAVKEDAYAYLINKGTVNAGITANGTLPVTNVIADNKLDARNIMKPYFRWEDGSEVDTWWWRQNEPNNDQLRSQDYGVFMNGSLCDFDLPLTGDGQPLCEIYPFKKSAQQPIGDCKGTQFKINEPCRERLIYRGTTKGEAGSLCARRHPVDSVLFSYDEVSFQCQYEAHAMCKEDEALIYNKCYKFHSEKKTIKEAAEECSRTNTVLPYITSKSHAKFLAEYATERSIDSFWINLQPSGRKQDGKTGYNRFDPVQIMFHTMTVVDPETEGETMKKLDRDAGVILRTSDYLNAPRGFFERVEDRYKSAFVCAREPDETDVIELWCAHVSKSFHHETYFVKGRCYMKTANFYQRKHNGNPTAGPSWKACKMFGSTSNFFSRNAIVEDFTQLADLRAMPEERVMLGGMRRNSIASRKSCCDFKYNELGQSCVSDADRLSFNYYYDYNYRGKPGQVPTLWEAQSPSNECSDFVQGSVGVAYFLGKLYDVSPLQSMRLLCEHGKTS